MSIDCRHTFFGCIFFQDINCMSFVLAGLDLANLAQKFRFGPKYFSDSLVQKRLLVQVVGGDERFGYKCVDPGEGSCDMSSDKLI